MHVSMRTLLPTFTFKIISSGSMVYQVLHGHQVGMTTPILYVTKEATKVIQQDGGRVWDPHPALTPRLAFSHWILSKPKRNQLQIPLVHSRCLKSHVIERRYQATLQAPLEDGTSPCKRCIQRD